MKIKGLVHEFDSNYFDLNDPSIKKTFQDALDIPDIDNYYNKEQVNELISGGASYELLEAMIKRTSIEFSMPSGITSIGDFAFYGFNGLTKILDTDDVLTVGMESFESCNGLTSVSFKNVTSIGESAFYACIGIVSAEFPNATTIVDSAFNSCTKLETVDISSVQTIGSAAFQGCTSLVSIILPISLTSLGEDAFADCSSLTDIYYEGTEEQWQTEIEGIEVAGFPEDVTIHYEYTPE